MSLQHLKEILVSLDSVLVAFSGGVDSTLLLKVAHEVLGERAIAATATSDLYQTHETEEAKAFTAELGVKHLLLPNESLSNETFVSNPTDRCYWCKKDLFTQLKNVAKENGVKYVIDGTNLDDLGDYRPGLKALDEIGIRSPLKEANLTKAEIREISKMYNLPTWDKPSFACLASRFPYGTEITISDLDKIQKAEERIRSYGIKQFRVRHHGNIARIEIPLEEILKILEDKKRTDIVSYVKSLGYSYVTLDLEGYRTGSLNEVL